MSRTPRPHDETMVKLLLEDPAFLALAAAIDEAGEIGGQQLLLAVLRQVAEAQRITAANKRSPNG